MSDLGSVDYEARACAHLVVEAARHGIGLVRLPVDARRTGCPRLRVDERDQRSPNAPSSDPFARKEILQIADARNHRGAAMEEIVHEPDKLAIDLGDTRVDRL